MQKKWEVIPSFLQQNLNKKVETILKKQIVLYIIDLFFLNISNFSDITQNFLIKNLKIEFLFTKYLYQQFFVPIFDFL